jgi:hypothetical protein
MTELLDEQSQEKPSNRLEPYLRREWQKRSNKINEKCK